MSQTSLFSWTENQVGQKYTYRHKSLKAHRGEWGAGEALTVAPSLSPEASAQSSCPCSSRGWSPVWPVHLLSRLSFPDGRALASLHKALARSAPLAVA